MYDDLARTQTLPPLEWFVVHAMIPSVLITTALHWSSPVRAPLDEPTTYVFVCQMPWPIEPFIGGPIPDVFPVLVRMPLPQRPDAMRRAGIEGRVVVKALVNTQGRVEPSSILVLRTTDVEFVAPARRALSAALFRPARLFRERIAAWITITIEFNLTRE